MTDPRDPRTFWPGHRKPIRSNFLILSGPWDQWVMALAEDLDQQVRDYRQAHGLPLPREDEDDSFAVN